jgi:hypothetical protein
MLKILDSQGNVVMVLKDGDTQPELVKKMAKDMLDHLGIVVVDTEDETKRKLPSGISQDDDKHIRGQ